MHILITRPLDDSEEIILKFRDLGHKVSHMPVIEIEKVSFQDIDFGDNKIRKLYNKKITKILVGTNNEGKLREN